MSIVEIRTTRVGEGKSSRTAKMVLVDGHDISTDVLSVDVHIDGKGRDIATVTLVAAVVETESTARIAAMSSVSSQACQRGWRSMPTIRKAISEVLGDLADDADEPDFHPDLKSITSDILTRLEKGPTP